MCLLEIHYLCVMQTIVKCLIKQYDMSASDIDHAWQSKLSNPTMGNVNVLPEMIQIRNGFKGCQIFYNDDVNSIIMDITVFLNIVPLPF